MKRICLCLCLLLLSPGALADDDEIRVGPSVSAGDALAQIKNVDDLVKQSRELLSVCIVKSGCPSAEMPEKAETLALQALAIDADNIEARMQLAIAISIQARDMPMGKARKERVAERMKAYAESVLKDDPDNAWAHGFLAVWHVEVRRRGGTIGAAIMGASLDKARTHFAYVEKSASDNLILRWQYARALAALDPERYDDEIRAQLQDVSTLTCQDQIEQAVQKRAEKLLGAIRQKQFAFAETFANTQM